MYFEYLLEREGYLSVQSDVAFLTYKYISQDTCYLRDIYVKPEARRTRAGTELASKLVEIIKQDGITKLMGSVCLDAPEVSRSIKALHSFGFEYASKEGNMLYFIKEL